MIDWKDNPEIRYREGYEQGAEAVLRKLQRSQSPLSHMVESWLNVSVKRWREVSQQDAAGGIRPSKAPPPPLRD